MRLRPTLAPFYYLANFDLALTTIQRRYADLLSAKETDFIARFAALPKVSRALLVRMISRTGVLFRLSKLCYPEIGDCLTALEPLVGAGWVDDNPTLSVATLTTLLAKPELIKHFRLPPRHVAFKKEAICAMLAAQHPDPKPFAAWGFASRDRVYQLVVADLCERFRMMFFGNARQGWSEFVLADLGIFTFEKIATSLQSRAFGCRAHIEAFRQLQVCVELLESGAPLDGIAQALPGPVPDCDWLEERRQKLMFRLAGTHERAKQYVAALEIYTHCAHPGARMRAARLHERLHAWETARELCARAQAAPENRAELQVAHRIMARVHRKLGFAAHVAPEPRDVPSVELFLDRANAVGAVEYRVRDHLALQAEDADSVRYVENDLINSLFGLLCWSAIYAPIPGAFFHDFHRAPADFASGAFVRRREAQFSACFAQLRSGEYRSTIWANYRQKWGIQSPFVRWQMLDRQLLQWALACFPRDHLALLFEWIARDVQSNRTGFPDLVQFWPRQRKYRMIEVKAPGDRIQDNQQRLLEYCVAHELPVSVCHVRWQ